MKVDTQIEDNCRRTISSPICKGILAQSFSNQKHKANTHSSQYKKNNFIPKIETKIALESWIVFDIYLNSIYNILPGFPCIVNWHICYQNYILNTVFNYTQFRKRALEGAWLKFFQIPRIETAFRKEEPKIKDLKSSF